MIVNAYVIGVCESPIAPQQGIIKLDRGQIYQEKYSVGSHILFECFIGFRITKGNSHSQCRVNGWYPSTVPVCEGKHYFC